MNKLGIDISTQEVKRIINRLKSIKSTFNVTDGGQYHYDHSYSQVWIDTTLTIKELDDWLYKNNFDYDGIFERRNEI